MSRTTFCFVPRRLLSADDKEEAVYYTLNGIMVAKENLIPGLYIKKTATKTVKVVIK